MPFPILVFIKKFYPTLLILMAVIRTSPGNWVGIISDQYMVGIIASGGYLTTLATKCAVGELEASQDPLPKGSKKDCQIHLTQTYYLSMSTSWLAQCRETSRASWRFSSVDVQYPQSKPPCFKTRKRLFGCCALVVILLLRRKGVRI